MDGAQQKPRLPDRVRQEIRLRHYSPRTEEAYVAWIRPFIVFHGKRQPGEMGEAEANAFLSDPASAKHVSASTQTRALCAMMFLYKAVLGRESYWIDVAVRPQRPARLPAVLTRVEVRAVLDRMDGAPQSAASLLCGAGLRLFECLELRVKDVEFDRGELLIRDGSGVAWSP
jgi:site-specific recombinase XerD